MCIPLYDLVVFCSSACWIVNPSKVQHFLGLRNPMELEAIFSVIGNNTFSSAAVITEIVASCIQLCLNCSLIHGKYCVKTLSKELT